MLYWTLLTFTIGVSATVGYQYCYECSSKSALCRNSVYDGHYLTRTPCKSVCFYRNEDNRVYRGCFDGWLGGIVRSDYLGCQTQYYLGEKVEWCFCNGTDSAASPDDDEQPCNGNHRDVIANLGRPTPRHTQNHREEEVVEEEEESEEQDGRRREVYSLQSRSKMFLPTMRAPEGRELTLETLREKQEERDDEGSSPGEIYEDDVSNKIPPKIPPTPTTTTTTTPPTTTAMTYSTCGGRYDGTYPDVTDCSRYVICTHGRMYWMRCSAGTVWDDNLQSCVFFAYHSHFMNPCVLPKRFKHFQYFQDREPIEVSYDLPPGDYDANYDTGMSPND